MDNSILDSNNSIEEEIEERFYKYNGEEVVKKYFKGKFLGKGGFAKVYEFKTHNKIYAAKIVQKKNLNKQTSKQKLKSEIKIHKSLIHSNIVKFEHVFEDSQNVYILLEICKSNTLNELIKKRKILTELEVRYFLDQILKAVRFMHKNKIIHRDLKLGNLFLNEKMEIKIGDFGLATTISYEGEKRHTICGTPNYIAPEILEGKATGHSYEVDYWAIGVIVYTLLIGRPPFETEDVKETYKRINNCDYKFPNHIFISEMAKDFIIKTLLIVPSDRLNLDMMRNHPFIKNNLIPKSLPLSIVDNPPDYQFYLYYKSEQKGNLNLNDLSMLNDSLEYKKYLEDLRLFALDNIKTLSYNKVNENFIIGNNLTQENNTLNKNTFYVKNNLNFSQNKETHSILKIKKESVNLASINYVDNLVDYSSQFGYLFVMNNNISGVYFKDKSIIHKFLNQDEFFYSNKNINLKESFNIKNLKDVSTDIKSKLNILQNYEKYLNENFNKENNNLNLKNIYVKKIIMTDISYVCKLSNNVIQLIFMDKSKIIIDNYETKNVIFIDKNNKMFTCDIHLVNKCNNKKLLKRYEHYKKVFYEKMEERFQRHQNRREEIEYEEKEEVSNESIKYSAEVMNKTL